MAIAIACSFLLSHELARGVTVAPGGSGAIGVLPVADFLPNQDDVLEIEFQGVATQGVDYDYLDAANFALLDGTLEFKQINAFTPSIGQGFDFLEGLQVQFEFDAVSWPNAPSGVALGLDYPMNPVNGVVGVEFFAPHMVSYTGAAGGWNDLAVWDPPALPTLRSDVELRNTLVSTNRTVGVDTSHAFSHAVTISAVKTSSMTLNVAPNLNLSATHGIGIEANGILAGRGSAVGPVSNPSGTVSPGTPSSTVPGTLTIDGSYDQGPAGTLAIDLRGPTADLLSVAGDVTVDGTLDISLIGSAPPLGLEIPIVQTTGGIRNGYFDNFNVTGLDAFTVRYDEQVVYLSSLPPFDMDRSGQVDEGDIDEFLLALVSPGVFLNFLNYSPGTIGSPYDGDSFVDYDDISAFEAALAASGVFVSIRGMLPVPEPPSWCLVFVGLSFASIHCRRGCHLRQLASLR
jgi:hypothetical protein